MQDAIYDDFAQRLTTAVEQLRMGDGRTEASLSPLIDQAAVDKAQAHIADALSLGASYRPVVK